MIFERVKMIIAEQFSVDQENITMDTSFESDLGADSLDIVELSMALEESFDVGQMADEELAAIVTVGDLVHFIQDRVGD